MRILILSLLSIFILQAHANCDYAIFPQQYDNNLSATENSRLKSYVEKKLSSKGYINNGLVINDSMSSDEVALKSSLVIAIDFIQFKKTTSPDAIHPEGGAEFNFLIGYMKIDKEPIQIQEFSPEMKGTYKDFKKLIKLAFDKLEGGCK